MIDDTLVQLGPYKDAFLSAGLLPDFIHLPNKGLVLRVKSLIKSAPSWQADYDLTDGILSDEPVSIAAILHALEQAKQDFARAYSSDEFSPATHALAILITYDRVPGDSRPHSWYHFSEQAATHRAILDEYDDYTQREGRNELPIRNQIQAHGGRICYGYYLRAYPGQPFEERGNGFVEMAEIK